MKTCTKCGNTKDLEEFYKLKSGKYGVMAECKSCNSLRKQKRYYLNRVLKEKKPKEFPPVKTCSKCGIEKTKEEFYTKASGKDGLNSYCKVCVRARAKKRYIEKRPEILAQAKEYHEKNKPARNAAANKYWHNNKQKCSALARRYREDHKDELRIKKIAYHQENRETILPKMREYYQGTKEEVAKHNKEIAPERNKKQRKKRRELVKESKLIEVIALIDSYRMESGLLQVKCKNCGIYFNPTYAQLTSRAHAIEGRHKAGEAHFYCSDRCKVLCPLYGFNYSKMIDPRSKLYTPKQDKREARRCQQQTRKAFLESQLDEFNENFCEKCGQKTPAKDLQLHHTKPVSIFGKESMDASTQVLVCKVCHPTHSQCLREFS